MFQRFFNDFCLFAFFQVFYARKIWSKIIFFWWQSWNSSAIAPVSHGPWEIEYADSVLKHFLCYYRCWKQLCWFIFLWKLIHFTKLSFEIEVFTFEIFTVHFDQFNWSLLNKSIKKSYWPQLLNSSVITNVHLCIMCGFLIFNRVRVQNPFSFTYSFSLSFSGLWNLVFLFSNLSLVFLMPFAYFFTESEGFAGSKKVRNVISVTGNANTEHLNSVLCLMSIWYVFSPLKGHYGASLWDCCNAAAAQSAGPGHFLGGISPHPSQHCPWESLW